jgi:hypothetical protein
LVNHNFLTRATGSRPPPQQKTRRLKIALQESQASKVGDRDWADRPQAAGVASMGGPRPIYPRGGRAIHAEVAHRISGGHHDTTNLRPLRKYKWLFLIFRLEQDGRRDNEAFGVLPPRFPYSALPRQSPSRGRGAVSLLSERAGSWLGRSRSAPPHSAVASERPCALSAGVLGNRGWGPPQWQQMRDALFRVEAKSDSFPDEPDAP